MSQHTRGPWVFEAMTVDKKIHMSIVQKELFESGKKVDLVCLVSPPERLTQEDLANAKLIAASPEMFDLLVDLQVILPTALHNGHHDLIQRVNEVLKKVRGDK